MKRGFSDDPHRARLGLGNSGMRSGDPCADHVDRGGEARPSRRWSRPPEARRRTGDEHRDRDVIARTSFRPAAAPAKPPPSTHRARQSLGARESTEHLSRKPHPLEHTMMRENLWLDGRGVRVSKRNPRGNETRDAGLFPIFPFCIPLFRSPCAKKCDLIDAFSGEIGPKGGGEAHHPASLASLAGLFLLRLCIM